MNGTATWRLNATDEMLHTAGETLGSARIVQVLWRFPTPVPRSALEREWRRLNRGRLSRRAAPAAVPGARRKWVAAHNGEPLHTDQRPLAGPEVQDWIDTQVRAPLPVGSASMWRLAAAPYRDGHLVSLTVPHFRCDGLGLFHAIASHEPGGRPPEGWGAALATSDLGEALGQVARALAGSAQWTARLLTDSRHRARLRTALRGAGPPAAAGSAPRFFTSAIAELDAGGWEKRARAHGGTVNSLFVEMAANLVRRHVRNGRPAAIDVGIPTSLRHGDSDGRANALVVVPLTVPGGEVRHNDLRRTREETKDLLRRTGGHSGTLVPEPLWHLLPARWAGALKAPGAQQTDVVASNFGTAPDGVVHFAGGTADSVALRTMNVPGVVPEKARLRASLCLLRTGDRMTVTATGMPDHFGDSASLYRHLDEEFAAWGLTARPWWNTTPGTMEGIER
ncbi:hypothetical protein [Streptomyces sp. NPDC017529]|uniref:hypothetical protein n=1 Tax=Streptomyces sp. NPDC017529 TaxID=3365000 RepID=UPI0037A6EEA4